MSVRVALATVAACIVVLAAVNLTAILYSRSLDSDRVRDQIEACERGNVLRARVSRIARQLGIPPVPLVDCQRVFE